MSISAIKFFSNLNSHNASKYSSRVKMNSSQSFKGNDKNEIMPGAPGYASGKGHYEYRSWSDYYPEDWDGPRSGAGYDQVWVPDQPYSENMNGISYPGSGD